MDRSLATIETIVTMTNNLHSNVPLWHSLRTRATVFTLIIFVLGIWSLSFYVSRSLRADMELLLGEQQLSVVAGVAQEVNNHLTQRFQALEMVANDMDASLMARPAALQTRLEQLPLLQMLFNGGVWVANLDGTAITDVPLSANRTGINYMDRDFIVAALKEGKSTIGRPVMGNQLKEPLFAMSTPVRDAHGKVMGAIVGVTYLSQPSFLDTWFSRPYGKRGGYLLVAPQTRQIITATDKKRVMELLPPAGVSLYVDRDIAGWEGFEVGVNALGEKRLGSVKRVPVAGWYIALMMPAEEAFAPIHDLQQRLLWATLLLTLLTGALSWWVLKRQLAPLMATADAMAALAESEHTPQPLALTHQGEIGQLVRGFNSILQTWAQRETALQKSQQNLAITLDSIGDAVIATDAAGLIMRMNPTAERLTAWPLADALGLPLSEVFRIVNADTRETVADPVQKVMAHGDVVGLANHTVLLAKDGKEYQIADSAAPIRDADNAIVGVVLVFSDVTERKRNEQALQQSVKDQKALLMEVHHRVKNNLQVISSLLRMEARRSKLADTRAVLTEMQGRIRSMALLHTSLYRSGTFASVDLGNYLQQVASQAFGSQSLSPDLVRLTQNLGAVQVGMDQAISAGLLVNELISNCLKHGFPQERSGEVSVTLQPVNSTTQVTDPQWCLRVSDTGVGLPADFEARRQDSLGLHLVDDLSQQIGGSLGIDSPPGQGAQFTVVFTALAPKSLVMPV